MSELDPVYYFDIGQYAEKVELYGPKRSSARTAHMTITEEQALDLVDDILTEVEKHNE